MPDRPLAAALGAVLTILAGILACLVLALALHLPPTRAAAAATTTTTTPTSSSTVTPAASAPFEYVPTPAGPPDTTKP